MTSGMPTAASVIPAMMSEPSCALSSGRSPCMIGRDFHHGVLVFEFPASVVMATEDGCPLMGVFPMRPRLLRTHESLPRIRNFRELRLVNTRVSKIETCQSVDDGRSNNDPR